MDPFCNDPPVLLLSLLLPPKFPAPYPPDVDFLGFSQTCSLVQIYPSNLHTHASQEITAHRQMPSQTLNLNCYRKYIVCAKSHKYYL